MDTNAVLVAVLFEAIGLPFCYAAADNMLNGNIFKGLVGFSVGLPFCVTGVAWLFFKDKFAEPFQELIRHTTSDARIWAFVLLMTFAWIALPAITPDHQMLVSINDEVKALHTDLVRYVLPRRVSADQYNKVLKYLSDKPLQTLEIRYVDDDRESAQYAGDLHDLFQAAKWNVTNTGIPVEQLKAQSGTSQIEGVLLSYNGSSEQAVQLVNGAFDQMKVLIEGQSGSSGKGPPSVVLYVGRRLRVYLPKLRELEVPDE